MNAVMPAFQQLRAADESWSTDSHSRASAVLMLFIPGADAQQPARIVFTRRSTLVRTHKGQIGFPGGRREAADRSPVITALREAQEEIGLLPDQVEILGALPALPSLDRRAVIPIVGFSRVTLPELAANADEVAEIFAVPWPHFAMAAMENLRFNVFGRWRETPYFPAQGYHIWGLTAWIIKSAELRS